MALFTAPTNDSRARALVQCDLFVIAENAAANNSTVRLIGRVSDNSASFGGNSTASTWRASINGVQQATGSIAYDFTGNSGRTYQFYIGDFTIGHAANGSGSVSATTFWQGNDGLTGSATAGGSITLTDFNRSPVYSDNTVVATASVGTEYSNGVSASNTGSYSVVSGALPTGLTLNTSNGAITGTPIAAGVFTFIIRANGSFEGSADTGTLTITVIGGGGKVWNGTSFVTGTTKAWDGTSFVSTTTKVWNGTSWVSAS